MLYSFVKILSAIACWLPRSMVRCSGDIIGALVWPFVPCKRRKMAVDNISRSLAVTERQAAVIAKQSAVRFGRMFIEVLRLPQLNRTNINKVVTIQGREHLSEALAQGRGAVLATAHSGNWELLGPALALNGFSLVGVAQKQTNDDMDRFINEYRTLTGMHVTYKNGVREMIKLLSEGQIIGLLMDQNAGGDGIFVEFFGRLASTPPGAAHLARLKDAPIVPAFITENSDGTHTATLHPPVWVHKTANRNQDILVTTQQLTTMIEAHIRKHPAEWFWLHNRWKHQPK